MPTQPTSPPLALTLFCILSVTSGCQPTTYARNQSWYAHNIQGWTAIRTGDYTLAQQHLTEALRHAEHFDATDRRLPETLDDLGLVYYQLEKDFNAEIMQGRAVTELLLTKGTNDPDLQVFIERLGYIYQRQGRPSDIDPIKQHPYMIFEMGYAVHDLRLAERLDALIYEYEQSKNTQAIEYLCTLSRSIRNIDPASDEPDF